MRKAKRKPKPFNEGNENAINERNENSINKGNRNDPFDGLLRPVIKNMIDMMSWHHRMLPNQLPKFLPECCVIHFIGAEETHNVTHSVYELYHCILESHSDRMPLSACLSKGETITIWEGETNGNHRHNVSTTRELRFGSFLGNFGRVSKFRNNNLFAFHYASTC